MDDQDGDIVGTAVAEGGVDQELAAFLQTAIALRDFGHLVIEHGFAKTVGAENDQVMGLRVVW